MLTKKSEGLLPENDHSGCTKSEQREEMSQTERSV